MHTARVVYEKVLEGAAISNEELEPAIKFFKDLENNLRILGPVFELSANEAGRVYRLLYDFSSSRKNGAARKALDIGVALEGNAVFISL